MNTKPKRQSSSRPKTKRATPGNDLPFGQLMTDLQSLERLQTMQLQLLRGLMREVTALQHAARDTKAT